MTAGHRRTNGDLLAVRFAETPRRLTRTYLGVWPRMVLPLGVIFLGYVVGLVVLAVAMRPLLVFGKQRFPSFPETPCSAEVGFDIALPQFRSLVVRAGTPQDRVQKLSDTLARVAESDEYKAFLKEQFADEKSFLPAAQAGEFLRKQLDDMKAAAKQAT